jgi:hypothetical protein
MMPLKGQLFTNLYCAEDTLNGISVEIARK